MPDNRPPLATADWPLSISEPRPPSPSAERPAADFPVVGVGASAGGLDACKKLIAALPATTGMAFILVQHLDPAHESLMVELLASHTALTVLQAADGVAVAPEHLYVIPPGTYLAVAGGVLHLSHPQARHGARLPFDFLLRSLADDYGARAIGVILSGTGADGSLGLQAVRDKAGFVIAQDPDEADYDGMPRSAIQAGAVDLVLPVDKIAEALAERARRLAQFPQLATAPPRTARPVALADIIDLLSANTPHDFRLYKPGTLQRRIERRMAMSGIEADQMDLYLESLRGDAREVELLAKDLLINVTGFFRDRKVFDLLAASIIPDLVRDCPADQPLRIWIAGCSSGEETYSLAMLLREAISAAKRNIKLQIFASDIDPDAVATAREGYYPAAIAADVGEERLERFFTREASGYRIAADLRAQVVFAVQDVLIDPPFARLDLVSCRNLLIYLQPKAQATVISLFHFALKEGGVLLLGASETVGDLEGRFAIISKPDRIYRRIGYSRPGALPFSALSGDGARVAARPEQGRTPQRHTALADLCREMVMGAYAPAATLINLQHQCLYSTGPIDRYLQVAPGHPTHDLLDMAREGLRTRLRSALQQASRTNSRVVVTGGRGDHGGKAFSFSVHVHPLQNEGETLLLVCFVDEPEPERRRSVPRGDASRVAEMEQELVVLRSELQGAIRELEFSSEEQKAINEEALSVNEEFQSTNEELLTSKEELQSLNEELTALNSQLQETLERQRTTSNDLQNVLYSTNVATIFLDRELKIRFFTPATKSLFNIIPGDVGRPLSDLSALAADDALLTDARAVLRDPTPLEREIPAGDGEWYMRRILPYRTQDDGIEGVVITFAVITDRRRAEDVVSAARRQAELANVAKSRFLAAASHDLRQPLQTLVLLHGLLAKTVQGAKARELVERIDETLGAMSGMLNALLDINQIDAGAVSAEISHFPVADLLTRMRDEFSYHAQAQGLVMRVVPCSLSIDSDPRLLEQIVRNLVSNALKYTKHGKVLLGCRRRPGVLSIEVWDSGIGIPEEELQAIFEEYHQLDNVARQRSLGLGLGLSIVKRMTRLLGYPVRVRSVLGRGSVFAVDIPLSGSAPSVEAGLGRAAQGRGTAEAARRNGVILVVEDDPEVQALLELVLIDDGHRAVAACDGGEALDLVASGAVRPDLILADFNLPGGLDGLQLVSRLRASLHAELPVIILTGDISTNTQAAIAQQGCVHLNKPVKLKELTDLIQRLLPLSRSVSRSDAPAGAPSGASGPVIYVVDDEPHVRDGIRSVLEDDGHAVEAFADSEAFLEAYRPGRQACLLIDAYLPGMSGLDLLRSLRGAGDSLPAIMITGNSDVAIAVEAMKAGASDFIEKPVSRGDLLAGVRRAMEQALDSGKLIAWRRDAADHMATLTSRQRQIMDLVLAGHPSKNIAADLGVSQRTVENHRAAIMKRTGAKSLPALARLALAASDRPTAAT